MFSIKSKGGDCWHYDIGVVLDSNSLTGQFRFDKRKLTVEHVNLEVTGHWYKRTGSWNKGIHISIKKLKKKDVLSQFKLYGLENQGNLRLKNTKGPYHGISPQY